VPLRKRYGGGRNTKRDERVGNIKRDMVLGSVISVTTDHTLDDFLMRLYWNRNSYSCILLMLLA